MRLVTKTTTMETAMWSPNLCVASGPASRAHECVEVLAGLLQLVQPGVDVGVLSLAHLATAHETRVPLFAEAGLAARLSVPTTPVIVRGGGHSRVSGGGGSSSSSSANPSREGTLSHGDLCDFPCL